MKTPEEMRHFFRSIPSKKKKENPYWVFDRENTRIDTAVWSLTPGVEQKPFKLETMIPLLTSVRNFFRSYYESFQSEAQVLCVSQKDGETLNKLGIPILTQGEIGPFDASVMVLPQDNSGGTSKISESFWQYQIVSKGIVPIVRIHSHHVLDPYQSMTDYSTLNSGTMEMVLGKILDDPISVCYWLDVPGTDIKAQTFVARQKDDGEFETVPVWFHK